MASNASENRPLVGITAYGERARYGVWEHEAVLLPTTYPDMVIDGGGVPLLLPPRLESADAVDRLDAVVLAGGPDVEPARYGAEPHPLTGAPRRLRDAAETAVLQRALQLGIPVLAVCRGAQLLNVALGGTLVQHVPDVVGHTGHNPEPGVFGTTKVTLDTASTIGDVLGASVVAQCHHHQSIDRLGDGLVVTGWADDGTFEAVQLGTGQPGTAQQWVLGVQWHPEQDDPRLFTALVAAARERQEKA
ncbi:gamma-glutamyl-gamma-aminobutyrate hydrolase family protein [Actinomycetes bacterium KLBMP 9759]